MPTLSMAFQNEKIREEFGRRISKNPRKNIFTWIASLFFSKEIQQKDNNINKIEKETTLGISSRIPEEPKAKVASVQPKPRWVQPEAPKPVPVQEQKLEHELESEQANRTDETVVEISEIGDIIEEQADPERELIGEENYYDPMLYTEKITHRPSSEEYIEDTSLPKIQALYMHIPEIVEQGQTDILIPLRLQNLDKIPIYLLILLILSLSGRRYTRRIQSHQFYKHLELIPLIQKKKSFYM